MKFYIKAFILHSLPKFEITVKRFGLSLDTYLNMLRYAGTKGSRV